MRAVSGRGEGRVRMDAAQILRERVKDRDYVFNNPELVAEVFNVISKED